MCYTLPLHHCSLTILNAINKRQGASIVSGETVQRNYRLKPHRDRLRKDDRQRCTPARRSGKRHSFREVSAWSIRTFVCHSKNWFRYRLRCPRSSTEGKFKQGLEPMTTLAEAIKNKQEHTRTSTPTSVVLSHVAPETRAVASVLRSDTAKHMGSVGAFTTVRVYG